jgi:hypothetical protein
VGEGSGYRGPSPDWHVNQDRSSDLWVRAISEGGTTGELQGSEEIEGWATGTESVRGSAARTSSVTLAVALALTGCFGSAGGEGVDWRQREFDTAEANSDSQRARTGEGNADLMGYIDRTTLHP